MPRILQVQKVSPTVRYLNRSDEDQGPNDVFAIVELFMERLATHSHTGADSKEISVNFSKWTQDLAETVRLYVEL